MIIKRERNKTAKKDQNRPKTKKPKNNKKNKNPKKNIKSKKFFDCHVVVSVFFLSLRGFKRCRWSKSIPKSVVPYSNKTSQGKSVKSVIISFQR